MRQPAPRVSIIVPTRGRPELLASALQSVIAQSVGDWECIVIADGDDASGWSLPDDERLRLLIHEESRGPAAARNSGLGMARGEYVAFLDDDDVMTPHRLELALTGITSSRAHLVGLAFLDGLDGPSVIPSKVAARSRRLRALGRAPHLGQIMIRRRDCPLFRKELRAAEDTDWWLRIASVTSLSTNDSIGYLLRRHGGDRPGLQARTRLDARKLMLQLNEGPLAESRRLLSHYECRIAAEALRVGASKEALAYATRSFRHWPNALAAKIATRAVLHHNRGDVE